jgi:hypothetical protein
MKLHRENGLLEPFAEIHAEDTPEGLHLELTFALDPTIEKLAAAFYMDGSGSMQQMGAYGRTEGGFFGLFGKPRNPVQEAMQIMVPYMAKKDANGRCRVAYWATGEGGTHIEVISEMTAELASHAEFKGPRNYGGGTNLLPAVRDFVNYINGCRKGGEDIRACIAAIVTDGAIHDMDDCVAYTATLARAIEDKKFPRTNLVIVGVGSEIDEEQLEHLEEATPDFYTGRDIWCHAEAESVADLPELVAHLLDANIPAFWGGASVKDASGRTVQSFEDMVPAVVEFTLPRGARSFTFEAGGRRFVQDLSGLGKH